MLAQALASKDAQSCAPAWDAKLAHHNTDLHTWTYVPHLSGERLVPHLMTFRAKTNMYGSLDRHKVGCAFSGDRMRPAAQIDETRTSSHMPRKPGRRILLVGAVAGVGGSHGMFPGSTCWPQETLFLG